MHFARPIDKIHGMNHEMVEVKFRHGMIVPVNRARLANNVQRHQEFAKHHGLRPGQKTVEHFAPKLNLSSDLLGLAVTVYDELIINPS